MPARLIGLIAALVVIWVLGFVVSLFGWIGPIELVMLLIVGAVSGWLVARRFKRPASNT